MASDQRRVGERLLYSLNLAPKEKSADFTFFNIEHLYVVAVRLNIIKVIKLECQPENPFVVGNIDDVDVDLSDLF